MDHCLQWFLPSTKAWTPLLLLLLLLLLSGIVSDHQELFDVAS